MAEKAIDWELALTRANHNPALAQELLILFMAQLPAERKSIESAWQNKHITAFYHAVHRLHGATCYCGMPRLQDIAHQIEMRVKNNEHDQLPPLVELFFQELQKIEQDYQTLQRTQFS